MNILVKLDMYDVVYEEDLKILYDLEALTFEGLSPDSIESIATHILETENVDHIDSYTTMGSVMNRLCNLTEENSYPSDLHIISFVPSGEILAAGLGARRMNDIIDNNALIQAYHPFDESFFDDYEDRFVMYDEFKDDEI